LCAPVSPFVVVGYVGVYVEDGGEVLDRFTDCGEGSRATTIAVDGMYVAIAVDTGS
jgi:hypothetical protein